jgi:NAD(P)-dependent dehydrogenase (short-subunit alcohol dehydrogenase family)
MTTHQIWFITGSSRGFGWALASAVLEAGDSVVATARRPEQLTSAWNWTEEKRVRYSALQAEARQQAKATGVVLDAELISGDEVGSIVECAKRHHSDLLVLGLRKHSWLMEGHTAQDIAERAPCAVLGIK